MRREDSPEVRGVKLRLEAIDRLIADQEAYVAQLRLRRARLESDLLLVRKQVA